MQGKLVFSQSASTFLFLNRFSIAARSISHAEPKLRKNEDAGSRGGGPLPHLLWLLTQGEIRFAAACYSDGLRLILRSLVPHGHRVASVRNVFDFVTAAVVSLGEIRRRAHNEVSRHVGVHIAQQRHNARLVEGERALL